MEWKDAQIEQIRIICEGICYEGTIGRWKSFFIKCDELTRKCVRSVL